MLELGAEGLTVIDFRRPGHDGSWTEAALMADVLFVDADELLRAARPLSPAQTEALTNRLVVALARQQDLPKLFERRCPFHGILMSEQPMCRLSATLSIARAGYLTLPATVMDSFRSKQRQRLERLTQTEIMVLRCVLAGGTNRQISGVIDRNEAYVKMLVRALLNKLGLRNRTAAAIFALQQGVAPHPDLKPGRETLDRPQLARRLLDNHV
ncbi:hypothetical protein AUP43_08330 [Oceanibaculum pacificum]|uniref:HTH luxR-type domain-containing protein n=2 Tax=Oceanibaculum pacificum TaxID=580166 RepID=A0A154W5D9_9PROT|nr:hypothetical protein AUP43_08330 [Oceanibaculum pacificum]